MWVFYIDIELRTESVLEKMFLDLLFSGHDIQGHKPIIF